MSCGLPDRFLTPWYKQKLLFQSRVAVLFSESIVHGLRLKSLWALANVIVEKRLESKIWGAWVRVTYYYLAERKEVMVRKTKLGKEVMGRN